MSDAAAFNAARQNSERLQVENERLRTEQDRLREANQALREFIAELNNTARHEWAQAVDDATQRLFRKMSANPVLREAARAKEEADAALSFQPIGPADRKQTL